MFRRGVFCLGKVVLLIGLTNSFVTIAHGQFNRVVNIPPESFVPSELADGVNQVNVYDDAILVRPRIIESIELNYHGGQADQISLDGGVLNQRSGVINGSLSFDRSSAVNVFDGYFAPQFVRNQSGALNLYGGRTLWRGFAIGGELNVMGGTIYDSYLDLRQAKLTITDGAILDSTLSPGVNSTLVMTGGLIKRGFSLDRGSSLKMDGGIIQSNVYNGGTIELNGGTIESVTLRDFGTATIRGGHVRGSIHAEAESELHLIGKGFQVRDENLLSATVIDGLASPGDSVLLPDRGSDFTLVGTLADGSDIEIILDATEAIDGLDYIDTRASLRLTIVPEPSLALGWVFGVICLRRRFR